MTASMIRAASLVARRLSAAPIWLGTVLCVGDQETITTHVDLAKVPSIETRLNPEHPRMGAEIARFLSKQYPFWRFDSAREAPVRLQVVLHASGTGDITNRPVDLYVVLQFSDGSSRAVNPSRVTLFAAGELKAIWPQSKRAVADHLVRVIKEALRRLHDRFQEHIRAVPVADGVRRTFEDGAELPLPWRECCRLSASKFELRCRGNQGQVAIVSVGTGMPSDNGFLRVLHTQFHTPPAAPGQGIDSFTGDLELLVDQCTRVSVVEFDDRGSCPHDERLTLARE